MFDLIDDGDLIHATHARARTHLRACADASCTHASLRACSCRQTDRIRRRGIYIYIYIERERKRGERERKSERESSLCLARTECTEQVKRHAIIYHSLDNLMSQSFKVSMFASALPLIQPCGAIELDKTVPAHIERAPMLCTTITFDVF